MALTKTLLVRNVVSARLALAVFAVDSADLNPSRDKIAALRVHSTWSLSSVQIFLNSSAFFEIFGSLMCTEARTVVPRLVGQKVSQPRRLSRENGV